MKPDELDGALRDLLRSFAESVPVPDHLVASARKRHQRRVRRRVLMVSVVGVATLGIVVGAIASLARSDPEVALRSPSETEIPGVEDSPAASPPDQASIETLPEPVPLTLVAARPSRAGFVTIDLADGTITSYPPTAHTLPRGIVDGLSITATGDAVAWFGFEVFLIPEAEFSNEPLQVPVEAIPYIPGFAPSMSVVPTPDGTRLWIVQRTTNVPEQPASSTIHLIDLADGAPLLARTVESTLLPVGTTPTSLVLNHLIGHAQLGDEPPGTYVLSIDGDLDHVSTHLAAAADDDLVALFPEGDDGVVGANSENIELLDLRTGARSVVDAPPDTTWSPVGGPPISIQGQPLLPTESNDGRLLAAAVESSDDPDDPYALAWTLYEIDMQTGTTRPLTSGEGALSATWSRDGRWVAIIQTGEAIPGRQSITLLDATDPDAEPFHVLELPEERFVLGAG